MAIAWLGLGPWPSPRKADLNLPIFSSVRTIRYAFMAGYLPSPGHPADALYKAQLVGVHFVWYAKNPQFDLLLHCSKQAFKEDWQLLLAGIQPAAQWPSCFRTYDPPTCGLVVAAVGFGVVTTVGLVLATVALAVCVCMYAFVCLVSVCVWCVRMCAITWQAYDK